METCFTPMLESLALLQTKLRGLAPNHLFFFVEFNENSNFRPQYFGLEWLHQKVHRTLFVATQDIHRIGICRGKKDYRHWSFELLIADQLSSAKAVKTRHSYVEQHYRHLFLGQKSQCLTSRGCIN